MLTYDEKTCWETWLAGLEFSAPIFVAPDVLDALRCRRWSWQKSDLSLALASHASRARKGVPRALQHHAFNITIWTGEQKLFVVVQSGLLQTRAEY